MKEKPILFNTEMVKAILEDRKISTRRQIKRTPSNDDPSGYGFWKEYNNRDNRWYVKDYTHSCIWYTLEEYIRKFSKYHVGDTLWVRETFFEGDILDSNEEIIERGIVIYAADELREDLDPTEMKWKPSTHMPRRLARIFLKVKDVRIERFNDMKHDDFISEGVREYTKDNEVFKYAVSEEQFTWRDMPRAPWKAFAILWDSTLKKDQLNMYGWDANPWVWVVEFEKINNNKI